MFSLFSSVSTVSSTSSTFSIASVSSDSIVWDSSNIFLNWDSLFISIFQFVSLAASLAFCPDLPIANDNWSSGTITWANFSSSLTSTAKTWAGNKAAAINTAGSSFHSITSIFSPCNSLIIFWILTPFCPTHEPTGSIFSFVEYTATLLLEPASLEIFLISIKPS